MPSHKHRPPCKRLLGETGSLCYNGNGLGWSADLLGGRTAENHFLSVTVMLFLFSSPVMDKAAPVPL